ncbi:LytTR family DNA-binding domain-containing protein, partial [Eubacterium callanderi]|uniref:LytTR family DNA-binding domain-containing protein n=1 Tax=Eubacterium callanderi TaxID=53442 RepID=UPI0034A54AE1
DSLTTEGPKNVLTKDIVFIEYQFRSLKIYTKKDVYFSKGKIGDMLTRLKPFGFDMPHQSFIVNFFWIKKIIGFEIMLKNGLTIPVAQKKASVFRKLWNEYLQKYSFLS